MYLYIYVNIIKIIFNRSYDATSSMNRQLIIIIIIICLVNTTPTLYHLRDTAATLTCLRLAMQSL